MGKNVTFLVMPNNNNYGLRLHRYSTREEIQRYASEAAGPEFRLKVVILKEPEFMNVVRIFGTPQVGGITFRMKGSNEKRTTPNCRH